jgi:hypothetical protein
LEKIESGGALASDSVIPPSQRAWPGILSKGLADDPYAPNALCHPSPNGRTHFPALLSILTLEWEL